MSLLYEYKRIVYENHTISSRNDYIVNLNILSTY